MGILTLQQVALLTSSSTELINDTYEVKDFDKARNEAQDLELEVYNTSASEVEYVSFI